MTQEEKAKAYDEVVNKLKGFMAQGVDPLITRSDVQDFFPELAESEDERIRKEMIEIIKNEAHEFPASVIAEKSNSWIAWLEKQGEQKQRDQSTIELAEDHAYFAGRTKTIDEIKEALLSEVLPCFMHGGEADEVVAKLDEVLNQKK